MKSGVRKPHRYEPDLNPSYQDFAEHYAIAIRPARVRKPRDKAKVEVAVQGIERWVLAPLRHRTFFSLAELNAALREALERYNDRPLSREVGTRRSRFLELDRPALAPLPLHPYQFATWKKAKMHLDYHVEVERQYYSVPYRLIGKTVDFRLTAHTTKTPRSPMRSSIASSTTAIDSGSKVNPCARTRTRYPRRPKAIDEIQELNHSHHVQLPPDPTCRGNQARLAVEITGRLTWNPQLDWVVASVAGFGGFRYNRVGS